ncbi:Immediate-early protein 2 [Streptomyces alfalfae]|uniref:Immediate-early protein 2 n=1 Tax=Streptomyces alfalfae TaxID=1642299 RepID=A0A1P8TDK7_9ACTN|nr:MULTISPECIES: Immediate-early protein 2 [Streptomyces]AYA16060.1 SRPBCC family protein [Streptomyces fradiae]APY85703.1 Immediate-early protein 2 [Streptomyces alfalfae]KUL57589.1 Immediate-early protein 2 [Streptomyces sp. NRRL S-1521]QQC92048.1 SRPBCC family protein [Streptomyces alfalfae]QUI34569.1 SRPBCC family protein [Streptomyces alfalfae]
MAVFQFAEHSPLSPAEAWRRLTEWERHGDSVPFTRVTVRTPPPTDVGTLFVARTALGPAGFDDAMEVVEWRPPRGAAPGRCRLEKRGSYVTGWAEFQVREAITGSTVSWHEDLRVRGLPGFFDGVLSAAGRVMFRRVVRRLTGGGSTDRG